VTAPNTGLQLRLHVQREAFTLKVNLSLPGSGVTALFGPSGSGKTTCLRAIAGLEAGLERPRSKPADAANDFVAVNGEIWQDDAHGVFLPTHRRALGFVFQEASLFPHLSVAQNLAFGQSRVAPAQRRVSLEHAIELLGIGPLLARVPTTLSGGERQRVSIARALATSPRLLLMDEPLAALDAKRKAEIFPYLETLHRELQLPILYVSHAIDEVARLADHLALIESGQVIASGDTAELMTRLDLPLTQGDGAGAIITATVVNHDSQYVVTVARFEGGDLQIPQQQRSQPGDSVRIRVQARDVSLTLEKQTGTSIQNILPVRVTALSTDSPGQMMVQLDAAGTALLARVTARSAEALKLAVGQRLFAQVKGVAILR
jgi:molybdate transport system ATP-binding protein